MVKFDIAETVCALIFAAVFIGGGLYCRHLQHRLAEETDIRQTAEARVALCEANIQSLVSEANEREAAAAKALESARDTAKKAAARADYELSRAAAVPGDDCASAKARAGAWLANRGKR